MTAVQALLPATLLAAAVLAVGAVPRSEHLRVRNLVPTRETPSVAGWSGLTAGSSRWAVWAGAAGAGLVLGGPVLSLLLLGLVLVGLRAHRRRSRERARAAERSRAVEACGALAGELRAGRSPAEALEVAAELSSGPSRAVLQSAAASARLGGDVPAALAAGAEGDTAVPDLLRALAACWQVCSQTGNGLATAAERLADGLRAAREQDLAVEAALAGPKATAALLAVLPLAGVALAAGMGARPLHVLLHTPLGAGCLLLGCALDALGLAWTRRLVRHASGVP